MTEKNILWQCRYCHQKKESTSLNPHTLDVCTCGETMIDLEYHYCRFVGKKPIILKHRGCDDWDWIKELEGEEVKVKKNARNN